MLNKQRCGSGVNLAVMNSDVDDSYDFVCNGPNIMLVMLLRPDITVMIDWALKNQLSIYLSKCYTDTKL